MGPTYRYMQYICMRHYSLGQHEKIHAITSNFLKKKLFHSSHSSHCHLCCHHLLHACTHSHPWPHSLSSSPYPGPHHGRFPPCLTHASGARTEKDLSVGAEGHLGHGGKGVGGEAEEAVLVAREEKEGGMEVLILNHHIRAHK